MLHDIDILCMVYRIMFIYSFILLDTHYSSHKNVGHLL